MQRRYNYTPGQWRPPHVPQQRSRNRTDDNSDASGSAGDQYYDNSNQQTWGNWESQSSSGSSRQGPRPRTPSQPPRAKAKWVRKEPGYF